MKVKVLLIDYREVFREGLLQLYKSESKINAVSMFGTVPEVIEAIEKHKPDIVLIDPQSFESMDVISRIHQVASEVHIIVLTHCESGMALISAISAGATGYISKDISYVDLVKVVDLIFEGKLVIDQSLTGLVVDLFDFFHGHMHVVVTPEQIFSLTNQEKVMLALLAKDATNKEIAISLCVTENTVKVHIRNIMHKLHTRNRLEAGLCAIREGLLRNGGGMHPVRTGLKDKL